MPMQQLLSTYMYVYIYIGLWCGIYKFNHKKETLHNKCKLEEQSNWKNKINRRMVITQWPSYHFAIVPIIKVTTLTRMEKII